MKANNRSAEKFFFFVLSFICSVAGHMYQMNPRKCKEAFGKIPKIKFFIF